MSESPGQKPRKLRLDQFLKKEGLVGTGGEAKVRIQAGEVTLNGETCTQRGRGLRAGDVIVIAGETRTVEESDL
jgi:ribosome-associated protein